MKAVTSWVSVLVPDDGDPRHGYNGYRNLKCRCGTCRAAWADATSRLTVKRAERLAADPSLRPHGVKTTYTNWGCRCAECRAATAAYGRRRRANTG